MQWNRSAVGGFLTASLLFLAGPTLRGQAPKPADTKAPAASKPEPALPASLAGAADSGTFSLYKDEERLATITFAWKADGSFENHSTLSFAGQSVKQSIQVAPDKDGRWSSITMQSPAGDVSITRQGGTALRTRKDKTVSIQLKPGALLFDNFSPALMSQAVRAYDRKKGGQQTLPLFILPGVMIDITLERKEDMDRPVGGRDLKLTRYAYGIPGVDITVWADAAGKVYLAEVPSQHAAYVRDGYEVLRQAPETDPLLSKPTSAVRADRDVAVPMRDGVKLLANIYRPESHGPFPLILIRTPYKKEMSELQGYYYARRGYAVAIQDCRGRFGSVGTWEPFVHEPDDGHDSIEWLAKQPWCNSKVGMIGGSYLGWVQWWAASRRPPHLVTIIPNVAPPDPFFNIPYEYGAFFLLGAIWWADVLESAATADLSGAAIQKIGEKKYQKLLRSLPVIDLDKKVLGKENPYWRTWIEHPVNDAYWDRANFLDRLAEVRIPVFHQSGWFDGDGIGTKLNYLRMAAAGHPYQKLVLGPWGHSDTATRTAQGRDFGPQAIIDLPRDYLRWFDCWLKGVDNGITREPLVSLFVMGTNRWLHGPTYPLPETRFEKWYLTSAGKANTSKGDGRLTRQPLSAVAPPDRYTYDPADPTPDPNLYEEAEEASPTTDKKPPRSAEDQKREGEAYHEKIASARQDLLVYVTEPFDKPYTFVGPLSAVLYASSSARDTDWFMGLMEVDEKGKLFPLAEGKIRARFRDSTLAPTLLEPGKVYAYQLDLWQTGITIPKGHRLRIEVASARFPSFSRNLNTGGHNEKETVHVPAQQTIHHSPEYPSHLLLPTIPDEPAGKR